MIGDDGKESTLFYVYDIEGLIPEDHLLRVIDREISFSFIRPKVEHLYGKSGRPSVAPEIMFRMLLVGYLYGIRSERRLCEEVALNIAYRWFCRFGFNDRVPDHSTFSKNRHGRFKGTGIHREIFDEIVRLCMAKGLVSGRHVTVDGTTVKANASIASLRPIEPEQSPEEYLAALDETEASGRDVDDETRGDDGDRPSSDGRDGHPPANAEPEVPSTGIDAMRGKTIRNGTHRSTTDPDARLARKGNLAATTLGHGANILMDNRNRVILGVDLTTPDKRGETDAALRMLDAARERYPQARS